MRNRRHLTPGREFTTPSASTFDGRVGHREPPARDMGRARAPCARPIEGGRHGSAMRRPPQLGQKSQNVHVCSYTIRELRSPMDIGRGRSTTNVALWIVQGLLAALFLFAGGAKLVLPLDQMTGPVALPGRLLRMLWLGAAARGPGPVPPAPLPGRSG